MRNLNETLRRKASQLGSDLGRKQWDTSASAITRREIALTLNQMDQAERLHEKQLCRLLRIECYVDTELMQMKERMPRYSSYWYPEKEKLHKRLFEIDRERRSLQLKLEEKLRPLEDRLLGLVNRHEQLGV